MQELGQDIGWGGVGARPDTGRNFSWGAFSFYLVGRFENGPKMVRNLQKKG